MRKPSLHILIAIKRCKVNYYQSSLATATINSRTKAAEPVRHRTSSLAPISQLINYKSMTLISASEIAVLPRLYFIALNDYTETSLVIVD